jgi:quercetin dioxygenase-like cupin family protein
MVTTETIPFARAKELDNTIWFGPSRMSFLVTGEDTGGRFALLELEARQGIEPPLHVHEREDECFYVLDGEIDFTVGSREFHGGPGAFVFMPRGVSHGFRLRTETAKALLFLAPAGFENFFRRLGEPAGSFDVPVFERPTEEHLRKMIAAALEFGVSFFAMPKKPAA